MLLAYAEFDDFIGCTFRFMMYLWCLKWEGNGYLWDLATFFARMLFKFACCNARSSMISTDVYEDLYKELDAFLFGYISFSFLLYPVVWSWRGMVIFELSLI